MRFFRIVFTLKAPKEKLEIDFRDRLDDVKAAKADFNEKYRGWNKRMALYCVDAKRLDILLIKEGETQKENVSPLELGPFSKFLYHQRGWEKFTAEKSKLFGSVLFKELSRSEFMEMASKAEDNGDIKDLITHDGSEFFEGHDGPGDRAFLNRLNNKRSDNISINSYNDEDAAPDGRKSQGQDGPKRPEPSDISDQLARKTFEFLIETQNFGSDSAGKKATIARIKELLFKWLDK